MFRGEKKKKRREKKKKTQQEKRKQVIPSTILQLEILFFHTLIKVQSEKRQQKDYNSEHYTAIVPLSLI